MPKQQIIIWCGSQKDDIEPLKKAFEAFVDCGCVISCVTKSAHKQPVQCYTTLHELIQKIPDTVILAYIGASNAAGPLLSANAVCPCSYGASLIGVTFPMMYGLHCGCQVIV